MKRKKLLLNGETFDEDLAKKFHDELNGESIRAAVICGFAYIESLLKESLKRKLVKDKKTFQRVDIMGFEKILNICFCLGIISKEERSDFKILGKIRNEFAHNWEVKSFENITIGNKLDNLYIVNRIKICRDEKSFPIYNSKEKYLSAINAYYLLLHSRFPHLGKRIKEYKTNYAK